MRKQTHIKQTHITSNSAGRLITLFATSLALLAGPSTQATNLTWDADPGNTDAQDGGGTWDTITNTWWTGAANDLWMDAATNNATFGVGNGSPGLVTVSGGRTAGLVTFNAVTTGTYTLGGSGPLALSSGLTLNESALVSVPLSLAASQTWTVTTNKSLTVSGTIAMPSAVTLSLASGGTINLSGGNNQLPANVNLNIAGNVILELGSSSQLIAQSTANNNMLAGKVQGTGGGALSVNGPADLRIGGTASGKSQTLDLSGLAAFTYTAPANTFSVGGQISGSAANGTLYLATNTTITAGLWVVQDVLGGTTTDSTGKLYLGQNTTINADTSQVAMNRDNGTIQFNSGLTSPTLTIRGTDGVSRAAIWQIGRRSSSISATVMSGLVDLVTGVSGLSVLDAKIATLNIGDESYCDKTTSYKVNGTLIMGGGMLDVTVLTIARKSRAAVGNNVGTANGTFTQNGGTVTVGTLKLGDCITPGQSGTINAIYNLNGGTVRAQSIQPGTNNVPTTTRTFNWNDGTIRNYDASTDLAVNVPTLTLGGLLHTFYIDGGRAGTVSAALAGSGDLVKDGLGTLTLSGDGSGYYGNFTNQAGTVFVNGALPGTTLWVLGGATLAGSNTVLAATVEAGGTIQAGEVSGMGRLSVSSTLDLGASGSTTDATHSRFNLMAGGTLSAATLNVNGTNTIDIAGAAPTVGTNDLIYYTGTIGGNGMGGFKLGALPPGVAAHLQDNPGVSVQLVVTASTGEPMIWKGNVLSTWSLSTNRDWLGVISASPTRYVDNMPVTFDDTATSFSVNIVTNVNPSTIAVASSSNYTFSGVGSVTTYSLTNAGPGRLTIANNNSNHCVNGIALNGGTLAFDQPLDITLASPITGSGLGGTLVKQGPNMLTLAADNGAFNGPISVEAGTLRPGSVTALGTTVSGTAISGTGTLDVNGFSLGAEAVTISGAGVGGNGAVVNNGAPQTSALQQLALDSDAAIGGSNRWDVSGPGSTTVNLNGHTLTKTGTNDIAFVQSAVSDGNITINQGRLGLQAGTSVPVGSGQITVNSAGTLWVGDFGAPLQVSQPITLNGGTLQSASGATSAHIGSAITLTTNSFVDTAVPLYLSEVVSGVGGLIKTGASTLILTASNTWSGGVDIEAGVLQLGDNSMEGSLPASIAVVTNNGLLAYSRNLDVVFNTTMVGTGGFMQAGSGTVTMTNQQTYIGETRLASGKLALAGGNNTLSPSTWVRFTGNAVLDLGANSQSLSKVVVGNGVTGSVQGSGGSLTVNGPADLRIGGTASGTSQTLDLSGLTAFTYTAPANAFSVGGEKDSTTGYGEVYLATNSTITASFFGVQDVMGGTTTKSTGKLYLGQNTTINADTNQVGIARDVGTIQFNTGLSSPTLTIRGTDGVNRAAYWLIGHRGSGILTGASGLVDLVTGISGVSVVDAKIDTLVLANESYNTTASRTLYGTFVMGGGTLDVVALTIGLKSGSATGRALGNVYGTFTQNGGTVTVRTLKLGDSTFTQTGVGTLNGIYNLNGGTVRAQSIRPGALGATTTIRTFNWNDGTIRNYDASTDLAISLPLTLGGVLHTFYIGGGRAGTVSAALAGSGDLVKDGLGTLTLSGDGSGYYGNFTNQAGTVFVNGALPGATLWVLNGATLAGSNLVYAATVQAGGTIQAGEVSGTGTLSVSSTLDLGVSGSTTDATHAWFNVTAGGKLSAATLNVNGTNMIDIVGTVSATGTNDLIYYSGTIGGQGFAGLKLASLPAGVTAHLQDNPGVSVQLVVTAVVPQAPPQISGFSKLADGNFRLTFSGAFGHTYSVRASTDVALPVAGWTILDSSTFGSGGVIYDDVAATNYPQRFYLISEP